MPTHGLGHHWQVGFSTPFLTLASRAFAIYYGLQAIIATIVTWRYPQPSPWRRAIKLTLFPTLAILLFLIAIFAIPAH